MIGNYRTTGQEQVSYSPDGIGGGTSESDDNSTSRGAVDYTSTGHCNPLFHEVIQRYHESREY
ncbi:hypothetical protein CMI46_02955 [Candidatus Pacearchaeota archaeon]|nr:hypothetical protein [Candidatus Pacearchaeota archaeon]|tara:strand:+ start:1417 stop:1605 length:189 start_codon:yes stop_codon:yes gene_type:complete